MMSRHSLVPLAFRLEVNELLIVDAAVSELEPALSPESHWLELTKASLPPVRPIYSRKPPETP